MTDRELLELAAKAAGITGKFDVDCIRTDLGQGSCGSTCWNPLQDDGDALRLAVKLNMCVTSFTDEQLVGYVINSEGHNVHETPGNDSYAATRRAIVRAAAEIGKGLSQPITNDVPEDKPS